MTETTQRSQNETANNEGETTVDFRRYFNILRRWLWVILLAGLIAGGTAYVLSRRMTPVYETSTRLMVVNTATNNLADYNSIQASEQLTSTYAEILTDESVLQEVIGKLNLPVSTDTLSRSITVTPIRNTQLIEIKVRGTNPKQAAAIANTLVETFINRVVAIQSDRYSNAEKSFGDILNQINNNIQDTKNQINSATDAAEKDRLGTELAQYQQAYATLVSNYELARAAEAQFSANVVQLNKALPPAVSISPKVKQNTLLASILAMLMASAIFFGLDALDDTIRSPEQISRITGLPILGVIAKQKNELAPISYQQLRSPVSEAFRAMRANIQYTNVDQPLRTLMVTSPSPMEGKTAISTNLAIIYAHAFGDEKVILVDADLRHPKIHERLLTEDDPGITSLLLEPEIQLNSSLKKTDFESLRVLPAGGLPPNPMEMLGSHNMRLLLDQLSARADMVIIDTPPILPVADAVVLSTEVDGILLVLVPGVTRVKEAQAAVDRLRRVNARIIGFIFNKVDQKSQDYYFSTYYEKRAPRKIHLPARVLGVPVTGPARNGKTKEKLPNR